MKSGTILPTEKVFSSIPHPHKIENRGFNTSNSELSFDEILNIIEKMIIPRYLNKIQILVLQHTWQGRSYAEIANITNYDFGYVKDTGSKLWQMLSETLDQKVTKQNVQLMLQRYIRRRGKESYPTFRGLHPGRGNF